MLSTIVFFVTLTKQLLHIILWFCKHIYIYVSDLKDMFETICILNFLKLKWSQTKRQTNKWTNTDKNFYCSQCI